jgi:hypothetical protein
MPHPKSSFVVDRSLLTRREALQQLSAASLLALGWWPGALRAAGATPPDDDFTFVVINDTHYMSPECGAWLERVFEMVRAEKPVFCLHAGDIVDNGTRENHAAAHAVFARLGVPLHVQIGNHDHATQTDRAAYEEFYPGKINYRFDHGNWQFVAVDSTEGLHFEKTAISEATLRWVDTELPRLDRMRPLVLFTHFPLADGVKMQPLNANALLERFRDHNLQAVFNGHFHGYTEHTWRVATVTTNRCCALKRDNHDGTHERGFFVCTARAGRISRRYVEVPMPTAPVDGVKG